MTSRYGKVKFNFFFAVSSLLFFVPNVTHNNYCCLFFYAVGFQKLCDYVSDLLLEESNVQPVSTPVTVCGDIHGQVIQNFSYKKLFGSPLTLLYDF